MQSFCYPAHSSQKLIILLHNVRIVFMEYESFIEDGVGIIL